LAGQRGPTACPLNEFESSHRRPPAVGRQRAGLKASSTPPSSLSGYIYCDPNHDGVKQPTEPGIGGVSVALTGKERAATPCHRRR
jgi:hypothetical protein